MFFLLEIIIILPKTLHKFLKVLKQTTPKYWISTPYFFHFLFVFFVLVAKHFQLFLHNISCSCPRKSFWKHTFSYKRSLTFSIFISKQRLLFTMLLFIYLILVFVLSYLIFQIDFHFPKFSFSEMQCDWGLVLRSRMEDHKIKLHQH